MSDQVGGPSPAKTPAEFAMTGTREVVDGSATHLLRQISALESAVLDNPGLAFDLAKSLVESVCKTILADRGIEVGHSEDTPKLFHETLQQLQLLPESHSSDPELAKSLKKTMGSLQSVVAGLCELRNREGFASHGRDAYSSSLESVQAQLAARSADALIHFLLNAHRNYPSQGPRRRVQYHDNADFNSYLNETNDKVVISGLEYEPSYVLFNVDDEAYKALLAEYAEEQADISTAAPANTAAAPVARSRRSSARAGALR